MNEIAIDALNYVEAPLNYLADDSEKPVSYAYEPPPGVPWATGRYQAQRAKIHDLRPVARELTLDEAGFQLVTHESKVENFWDEAELKRVYYPETIALLKAVTGASRVHIFDHTLRRRVPK